MRTSSATPGTGDPRPVYAMYSRGSEVTITRTQLAQTTGIAFGMLDSTVTAAQLWVRETVDGGRPGLGAGIVAERTAITFDDFEVDRCDSCGLMFNRVTGTARAGIVQRSFCGLYVADVGFDLAGVSDVRFRDNAANLVTDPAAGLVVPRIDLSRVIEDP